MARSSVASVVILCAGSAALGGEPEAEVSAPASDSAVEGALEGAEAWTIRFEPMVWAPALRGDIKLPASSAIDVETIGADENEIIAAGRLTLRADRWSFQFRGFSFSLDESAAATDAFTLGGAGAIAGTNVLTDLDLAGFDLTVGYRIWTPLEDVEREVRIGFDIHGGARVHSLDISVRTAAALGAEENTWIEPIGGARMSIDLPQGFGVNVAFDAGGFPSGDDSSFSWDITVAFSWMFLSDRRGGLEIGFRHLDMNLNEGEGAGELEFDAALAGLFGAIVIRF